MTVAHAIKSALHEAFLETTFSVTTQRSPMSSSVHVEWTDGPSRDDVSRITSQYEAGYFDGMTDSYVWKEPRQQMTVQYVIPHRHRSDAHVPTTAISA